MSATARNQRHSTYEENLQRTLRDYSAAFGVSRPRLAKARCRSHRNHSTAWPGARRPTGPESAADVCEVAVRHVDRMIPVPARLLTRSSCSPVASMSHPMSELIKYAGIIGHWVDELGLDRAYQRCFERARRATPSARRQNRGGDQERASGARPSQGPPESERRVRPSVGSAAERFRMMSREGATPPRR